MTIKSFLNFSRPGFCIIRRVQKSTSCSVFKLTLLVAGFVHIDLTQMLCFFLLILWSYGEKRNTAHCIKMKVMPGDSTISYTYIGMYFQFPINEKCFAPMQTISALLCGLFHWYCWFKVTLPIAAQPQVHLDVTWFALFNTCCISCQARLMTFGNICSTCQLSHND